MGDIFLLSSTGSPDLRQATHELFVQFRKPIAEFEEFILLPAFLTVPIKNGADRKLFRAKIAASCFCTLSEASPGC
ncbi:MAG: hypothetical protein A2Z97_11875 [Bdellovibrionales bacterium GWB1_52_6]|nr:MAG: hypothetical protein A2Z97_11875 [Bdellovibrionales bacterium GWB1_52_6]